MLFLSNYLRKLFLVMRMIRDTICINCIWNVANVKILSAIVIHVLLIAASTGFTTDRVVTVGGSITEIVFELGQADRLVARDSTSTFPTEAEQLPDVGYMRALSPEGLLSMNPDLVLAEADSGPPEAIDVLRSSRVRYVSVPDRFDAGAVREKIEVIADALGVPERGQTLATRVDQEIAEAMEAARRDEPPRMMFILSMAGGRVLAAGSDTAAEGIIKLAGGVNAVEGYEGYKPLSDEAAIATRADVIIMMDRGGEHAADDSELWSHPGLGATPAAASGAVVRVDGLLLLGFGPRLPLAIRTLTEAVNEALGAP